MKTLKSVFLGCFVSSVCANVAPVFSPTTYSASVAMNTSIGTTVTTVTFSDADVSAPDNTVTLSLDGTDGSEYFEVVSATTTTGHVKVLRKIDVEYGLTEFSFKVLAADGAATPLTATATISLTTLQSSTTTTTTPAPPGYEWLSKQDNVILLGCTGAFAGLLIGTCLLCLWRYNRVGRCLPVSCPTVKMCRGSCKRTCNCCPIPCDFSSLDYEDDEDDDEDEDESEEEDQKPGINYYLGKRKDNDVAKGKNPAFQDKKDRVKISYVGKTTYPQRQHFRV